METKKKSWNKEELKVYLLLLCANADSVKTEDELILIKSKVNEETFDKMHREISSDSEEKALRKISENIALHEYSQRELAKLHMEMREVFFTDEKFCRMEQYLERILRNILY